jgi:hypothetical protein
MRPEQTVHVTLSCKKRFYGNPVFGSSVHPMVNMFLFRHHKAMNIFGKDNSFSENRQTGYVFACEPVWCRDAMHRVSTDRVRILRTKALRTINHSKDK